MIGTYERRAQSARRARWLLALVLAPQRWGGRRQASVPLLRFSSLQPSPPARLSASGIHRQQFEALFARYQLPLLDYLYGMTRDREWAADLVQETFLRAYASTADLATITYPQAWLYRIATNLALSALRRRKRFGWLRLSALEPESAPGDSDARLLSLRPRSLPVEDVAATVAERDAVWGVLAELPPRWRSVLLLHTTGGFSVAEVASALQLSEANVRKILFRAKERFRTLHAQVAQRDQGEQPMQGKPDARGGQR